MGRNISLILVILSLLSLSMGVFNIGIVNASGSTIYVDKGGSVNYIRIQDAIDAADAGDTVFIYNGTYFEDLLVNKTINLIGKSKTDTIIDGGGNNTMSIFADNVKIQGLTVKNGTNGIMINGSFNDTITGNIIMDSGCGICVDNLSGDNTIYQNDFLNNVKNAYSLSSNNWCHLSNGNYWDDYNGTDADGDNVGDTPYNISGGNNQDNYPLMVPTTIKPDVYFTYLPSNPTTQDVVQFTDISKGKDGYITLWYWNFGDGNISTEQNATHKYADDGFYNVTLKVTDNYGATNELSQQLSISNVKPTADFSYSPVDPTDLQTVTFNDKSSDSDGYITNWLWIFGDGNTSNLQNPAHQYEDNGTYTITVTVTDDDGLTDISSRQISVLNVPPTVSFSFSSSNVTISAGDPVHFYSDSKDLDGSIVSWNWNFGDGTKSTTRYPTHNYTKKGTYEVSLTVIDNDGRSQTRTRPVTISGPLEVYKLVKGFSMFDLVFVIFLVIMVVVVIVLSKKYS